jgi:hypothetical protein
MDVLEFDIYAQPVKGGKIAFFECNCLIVKHFRRLVDAFRSLVNPFRHSGDAFRHFDNLFRQPDDAFQHSDNAFRYSDDSFRHSVNRFRRLGSLLLNPGRSYHFRKELKRNRKELTKGGQLVMDYNIAAHFAVKHPNESCKGCIGDARRA